MMMPTAVNLMIGGSQLFQGILRIPLNVEIQLRYYCNIQKNQNSLSGGPWKNHY